MYSQNREEAWVGDFFGDLIGRFLDIGANDGKTISNTYALALKGWGGVYVEPSPRAFALLEKNVSQIPDSEVYRQKFPEGNRFTLLPIALGTKTSSITLYESGPHRLHNGKKNNVALLSTVSARQRERWVREEFTPIQVPCQTVASTKELQDQFDLVSIDAEGMDYAILRSLDLEAMDCAAVIVEWSGDQATRRRMIEKCEASGLTLRDSNFENLFFTI